MRTRKLTTNNGQQRKPQKRKHTSYQWVLRRCLCVSKVQVHEGQLVALGGHARVRARERGARLFPLIMPADQRNVSNRRKRNINQQIVSSPAGMTIGELYMLSSGLDYSYSHMLSEFIRFRRPESSNAPVFYRELRGCNRAPCSSAPSYPSHLYNDYDWVSRSKQRACNQRHPNKKYYCI